MTSKIAYVLFFSICLSTYLFAQQPKSVNIDFHSRFGSEDIFLNTTYYQLGNGDSVQFTSLRFYISDIELWKNEKLAWKEENSFHLLDLSKAKTMSVLLETDKQISYDRLKFNLGIDSVVNVSGAMGGDLDPTLGMYWTWQSGYINLKLEGKSNVCKTRLNEFTLHIGGYQFPNNALQQIVLSVDEVKPIHVDFDIERLFKDINIAEKNHIMSPGADAVIISKLAAGAFKYRMQ